MVGIDNSCTSIDDNAFYVWNDVFMEYTTKCIIFGQSSNGMHKPQVIKFPKYFFEKWTKPMLSNTNQTFAISNFLSFISLSL